MGTQSVIATALLAAGFIGIGNAAENRLGAQAVLEQIRTKGAEAFIVRYSESAAWNRDVLAGIESGNPAWLKVAELLKPKSDGAAAEEIGLALYGALPKRPFSVIPVLSRVYKTNAEQACTQTFEAAIPPQGVEQYLGQLEASLQRASSPAQRAIAAKCRRGIEATRAYVKTSLPR